MQAISPAIPPCHSDSDRTPSPNSRRRRGGRHRLSHGHRRSGDCLDYISCFSFALSCAGVPAFSKRTKGCQQSRKSVLFSPKVNVQCVVPAESSPLSPSQFYLGLIVILPTGLHKHFFCNHLILIEGALEEKGENLKVNSP